MGEPAHTERTFASSHAESGFTIVEVMVAMVILLIGVLGTLTVITGSYASTGATVSREQGTNLARDLVERSRQIPFADSTVGNAPTALRNALPASDNAVPDGSDPYVFTLTRRGTPYSVRVFACSVDDPSNGIGVGDATFCAPATVPTQTTTAVAPTAAATVNVLGIAVVAGGSLLETVCNAVGANSSLLQSVTGLVGGVLSAVGGATVQVCPGASAQAVPVQYGTPDDFHRVRVDVSWTRNGGGSVSQTTLLPNPN